MKPRVDPTPRLLALAEHQSGVLTCRQAESEGLGRHSIGRLVRDGSWQRLSSGLLLVGPGRPPRLAWAWGGVLLGGYGALLGGRAAGRVLGLIEREPAEIVVWSRRPEKHADRGPWRFQRQLEGVRRFGGGRPPAISVEDTVLDLIPDANERQVIDLVTRAVQHRLTTTARLRMRIAERGRTSHRSLLTDLLADVSAGAETPLELAYVRDVERAHRLPTGVRQHRDPRSGHHRDVWYEQWQSVVELDGRLGHEGTGKLRDMALDNLGVLNGVWTLRFGWHDVRGQPCGVARQVAQLLQRNGWTGSPRPCLRCRAER